MEKQISIIIPTYNMEAYLERCLDSLLIAEISEVEIIVVNDGSKDGSLEIAQGYASRYPQSIRVIDKPNGNYGSCINAALPTVTGRYVKVLDADDYFDREAFSRFVRALREIDSDVVITKFNRVDEEGIVMDCGLEFDVEYGRQFDVKSLEHVFSHFISMHTIAYKSDIFKRFEYRQLEGISYSDTQWSIIPMAYCNTVVFLDLFLYKYLVGREGQTVSAASVRKNWSHSFKILKSLLEHYVTEKDLPNRDVIGVVISNMHYRPYIENSCGGNEELAGLREYDEFLRDKCPEMYRSVGELSYAPYVKFKFVEKLRRTGFSKPLRLGMARRMWHSLCYRLSKSGEAK